MSDYSDFNQLVSKANKRYRRLAEKGWKTGALKKAKATGGQFHNKRGMSEREKAKEYQRVNNFLNSKTSTVRGSRKVLKNMLNRTGLSDLVDDTPDTIMTTDLEPGGDGSTDVVNKFFDIASMVDEYLENNRGVKVSSDEIWRSIHDTYLSNYDADFSDADADDMVANAVRKLHQDYLKSHGSKSSSQTWSTI